MRAEQKADFDDKMDSIGFVPTSFAASFLGMAENGHFTDKMKKYAVAFVKAPPSRGGRERLFYSLDDLKRVKDLPEFKVHDVVGGGSNGGVLRQQINELKARIETLEAAVKDLMLFRREFE